MIWNCLLDRTFLSSDYLRQMQCVSAFVNLFNDSDVFLTATWRPSLPFVRASEFTAMHVTTAVVSDPSAGLRQS